MKNKIYKILGVALALVLVFSLFGAFVPFKQVEAQAYTPNQWNVMAAPAAGPPLKLNAGGSITDFAVAPDGSTVYAVDGTAGGLMYKSTTGGMMWAAMTPPPAPFATPALLVAVAPDDPQAVAIVDTSNRVFYSTNGGAIWSDLGTPDPTAAETIMDIAVSPANAIALVGRNIVVCTSDPLVANFGDVYLIGTTATWTNVTLGLALTNTYDYTSVVFEPNWLGGQCVVTIGSGAATTGTNFQVLRTAPLSPAIIINAPMAVTAVVFPDEVGAVTLAIASSSLAVPADFDSTTPPMIQAYVGWTSAAGFDDVYRQDFNQTRKLQIAANIGIQSISFSGTLAGGTLFAGVTAGFPVGPQVWYSANPESALPSWSFSYKPPTGATNTVVQVAPDFDASGIVYAGTTGAESGFSRTTNGGVSYNQIGLINTTITSLRDVMPTPDNSTLFLTTSNGVPNSSLWKSSTPPTGGSWERVRLQLLAGYIIRLSPDYLDDSTLYWADLMGTNIQRSTTGGDIFAPRTAAAALTDLVVESQDVLYMGSGVNVYQSTNGAWYWGLPIPSQTGGVYTLAMAPTYPDKPVAGNVLVGGIGGGVSLSTDAAANFIPLLAGVPGAAFMQVCADKGYATNNIVYAGSWSPAQGIYRYEFGVSTAWENIRALAAPAFTGTENVMGLATEGGTLYGVWSTALAAPGGAERTMYPTIPDIVAGTFDTMNAGAPANFAGTIPSNLRVAGTATDTWLWAIDFNAPALMAYQDTMAKAVIDVTVPAVVQADPTTGRQAAFVISWNIVSNALAYNVGIFTDAGCTQWVAGAVAVPPPPVGYIAPFPLAPSWNVPVGIISSGTKYYVRVFVTDQTTLDNIRSQFAAFAVKVVSFTVEPGVPVQVTYLAPQVLGPAPGATGVPLSPGFTWSPYAQSTKYEFQLATDAGFSDILAETSTSATGYKYDGKLSYGATYFWRARAIEPAVSNWSAVATFTTEKAPPPPPPKPAPPLPPAAPVVTPAIIWAIIAIGAILVIAVIVLILRTRRAA